MQLLLSRTSFGKINKVTAFSFRRISSSQEIQLISELSKSSRASDAGVLTSKTLRSSHVSGVMWDLVEMRKYDDASVIYDIVDSPNMSRLKDDNVILASIAMYGGLLKPTKVYCLIFHTPSYTLPCYYLRLASKPYW